MRRLKIAKNYTLKIPGKKQS